MFVGKREKGKNKEGHPDLLEFSAPEIMSVFNQHATQLPRLTAQVPEKVEKMFVKQGDSQPDPGVDEAISTSAATTGNLFRWSDSQYIFNLSTKLGYTNPDGTDARRTTRTSSSTPRSGRRRRPHAGRRSGSRMAPRTSR